MGHMGIYMKTHESGEVSKKESGELPKAFVSELEDHGRSLKNGKIYSVEVIEKLKEKLKNSPDGRYNPSMLGLGDEVEIESNDLFYKYDNKLYVGLPILIGSGDFSDVSYLQELETGKLHALKTISPIKISRKGLEFSAEDYHKEVKILRDLNKGSGGFESKFNSFSQYHIIMNHVSGISGGTLSDGYSDHEGKERPPIDTCLKMIDSLFRELKDIHEKGYYFVDFKPDNMIFDFDNMEAHFVDYGSALKFDPNTRVAKSNTYAAPSYEDRNRQLGTTEATEVYALALAIAHSFDFIKLPSYTEMEIKWHDTQGENSQVKSLVNLLKRMSDPDPKLRPTLDQAINKLSLLMAPKESANHALGNAVKVEKQEIKNEPEPRIEVACHTKNEPPVNKDKRPQQANLQALSSMICEKLRNVPYQKLSKKHKKLLEDFHLQSLWLTGGSHQLESKKAIVEAMIDYFDSQCAKYRKNTSFFKFNKNYNAVAVLNHEPKDHHLTRCIGMVLKELLDPKYSDILKSMEISISPRTTVILGGINEPVVNNEPSLIDKFRTKLRI